MEVIEIMDKFVPKSETSKNKVGGAGFNKEIGRVWKWQSNDANTGMSMTRINTETCVRAAATISRRREKSIRLRFAPAVFSTAGTL